MDYVNLTTKQRSYEPRRALQLQTWFVFLKFPAHKHIQKLICTYMQQKSAFWVKMLAAVQMQVQPLMISGVDEQVLRCSPRWRWNPKRSLTEVQSTELQDGRTVTGEAKAIPGRTKKTQWETKYRNQWGSNTPAAGAWQLVAVTWVKGPAPASPSNLKFNVSSLWSKSKTWELRCNSGFLSLIHKDWTGGKNINRPNVTRSRETYWLLIKASVVWSS